MKIPNKVQVGFVIVAVVLAYLGFILVLFGAKPKEPVLGVCIYEVVINQLINHVSIGWTSSPCQDLDIREIPDHERLTHSAFNPNCTVFAIQTWPGVYLPIVDYADACALDFVPESRQVEGIPN